MYAVWSFAVPFLVTVPLSLNDVRMSNPIDIMLKSLLWQSSVLFLWSGDKRWVDSHKVNGALRKCYVPSVQDKVLFFWWESCHFIRYNGFLCQRVEILVCVKWFIVFSWLACWILDKKNKSYGRCQLFPVGLCVEICTVMRASQSIQIQPEQLCWQLRAEQNSWGQTHRGRSRNILLEDQKSIKLPLLISRGASI